MSVLCGSHLLRELTSVIDTNGYAWARNMKGLLQQTCRKVSQGPDKRSCPITNGPGYKGAIAICSTRAEKELPPIPAKPSGKRGKLVKSDVDNLHERLQGGLNFVEGGE